MSKGFKIFLIIILSFFAIVVTFNVFSGANNNPNATVEETPFFVSILVSWFPMLLIVIIYIIFLRMFKQMISIGERIAVALEKQTKLDDKNNI